MMSHQSQLLVIYLVVFCDVCTLKHFFSLSVQLLASLHYEHFVLRKKSQPTKLQFHCRVKKVDLLS